MIKTPSSYAIFYSQTFRTVLPYLTWIILYFRHASSVNSGWLIDVA
jgi:hypothetical protein